MERFLSANGWSDPRYAAFLDLLFEWNAKFNLTAVTDREEAEVKHIVDSLLGAEFVRGESVLDVGAGAGFPSLPLALAMPERSFTLVDSLLKRVHFLNEAIAALPVPNAKAIHARAEELPRTELYDTVTARAVAPLNVLCEYCLPFVKAGGIFLAYKGPGVDEELKSAAGAISVLGGGRPETFAKVLTETRASPVSRTFVVIEKLRPSPPQYPRGGNKPRLKPL